MQLINTLIKVLFTLFPLGLANFASAACVGDQSAKSAYKVYVVPQLTATQIYSRWSPLLERIGKETNHCFELIVPSSIPHFESDLLNGKPDFAYMNPYHAVMKWRDHQYIPLVASGDPVYGILAIQNASKITAIKDLSRGRIAFPAPNAFAASLLIRATLAKEGISFEPVYVKTHSNVYRSVIRGDVEAGGGIQSTLMAEPPELKAELKTLMETKRYTSHPFSANSRVPERIRKEIQDSLIRLDQSNVGSDLLTGAQLAKVIPVTYKINYQPLENLQLEKFVVKSAD